MPNQLLEGISGETAVTTLNDIEDRGAVKGRVELRSTESSGAARRSRALQDEAARHFLTALSISLIAASRPLSFASFAYRGRCPAGI